LSIGFSAESVSYEYISATTTKKCQGYMPEVTGQAFVLNMFSRAPLSRHFIDMIHPGIEDPCTQLKEDDDLPMRNEG